MDKVVELAERVGRVESDQEAIFRVLDEVKDSQKVMNKILTTNAIIAKDIEKILVMYEEQRDSEEKQDERLEALERKPGINALGAWRYVLATGAGAGIMEFIDVMKGTR